jgi:hypothetical protein
MAAKWRSFAQPAAMRSIAALEAFSACPTARAHEQKFCLKLDVANDPSGHFTYDELFCLPAYS